jgi:CRP/FNR family transcriptional regulator, cyclic AMP receptor protein
MFILSIHSMRLPYGLEITEKCLECKLRAGRLFCDLPRPTLEVLQTLGFTIACPKGTILFAQGQSPREIFVLCLGHVKIVMASPAGKEFCVGIVEPGTVLGLSAAISGKAHEVTVEAAEPCQLRVIKKDRFLGLLRNDGAACLAAIRCLSNDIQKTHECLRLLGLSHSVTVKLAKLLVQLSAQEPVGSGNKVRLTVPLTHQELAHMLGVTRETVTRLLTGFRQKKLIQHCGSNVVIQDEHALRVVAMLTQSGLLRG